MNMQQFLKDRKHALLSMDKATVVAYLKKYGSPIPQNEYVFWNAIHKARTGALDLPMFERGASKRWLLKHNSGTMDDGDVLPPIEPGELEKYLERCKQFGCE